LLDNLEPAKKPEAPKGFRPGVEFDGTQGTATTEGVLEQPSFDEFLRDRGYSPEEYEIVGSPRTSQWQRYDGEWLTSYRFHFRKKTANIDLPLLMQESKKKIAKPKLGQKNDNALVILWSDLQVGKVDYRGNSQDLISIMQQVDLATTLAWQTLKILYHYCQDITYASVGSNHCQWRVGKQVVGRAEDDWGVFIGRQLARLAKEKEINIRFIEPQPHDESLALDVFGDQFHILGMVHGHQARRPDNMATWWRQQAFGNQPVADASILDKQVPSYGTYYG